MTDFQVEPFDASFGATVIRSKLVKTDEASFRRRYGTWLEHALLIFPDQHLSEEQQAAFVK